ncbi:MAG: alpha/beta hydrolase-fold protein [Bacteroidota bacterium]
MTTKKSLIIHLITILLCLVHALNAQTNITVGEKHVITSTYLNEERTIQVSVPDNYEPDAKKYPVLYLLDGQRFFLYGVSLQQSFQQFKLTPDFIVVGINNSYPQRFRHFSETVKFKGFIERELVPFVESQYSTSADHLLFGWEYAGAFSLDLLNSNENEFSAYFLASPFPITQKRLDKTDSIFNSLYNKTRLLYFTVSEFENQVNEGVNELISVLKRTDNANWKFELLPNESHRSTPYHTIYDGLCNYYFNYPELQFATLAEYREKGGLPYVYEYYQQRSERFDFPNNITSWTKFSLIRNAVRADDLDEFVMLMEEFNDQEFLKHINERRIKTLADYYVHKELKREAHVLARDFLKLHPESDLIKEFLKKLK